MPSARDFETRGDELGGKHLETSYSLSAALHSGPPARIGIADDALSSPATELLHLQPELGVLIGVWIQMTFLQ